MQYTQQQRLAPEVPDESALYGPMLHDEDIEASACVQLIQLSFPIVVVQVKVSWYEFSN